MIERVNELTKYLSALSEAQNSGYKCNGEMAEVIRELRVETGLVNTEDKAGVYNRKITELCGDYYKKDLRFVNAQIYNAYITGISGEIYVSRCSGTTTSLRALAETFDDVVYTDERGHFTSGNLTDKVVFMERRNEIPRGARPKCVIKIRQIDFVGDTQINIF
ncbi:hypothetical protein [Neobacillus mesonae]|uniref:Uncharacterized protein n=1 Tax=Neobacillus mesonae TaxID=1193713 RepID=A0A3T0HVA5_9BACI|nr:hypothetical protein [Neobacillus mesonae]AZU61059.1 hypothetical protein CHR53_07215 [Neobacillus mesonae]